MQTRTVTIQSRPFRLRTARDLGAAVKHFRTLQGWSQQELARRSGLHRSYLAALEGGHTTEALEKLMALFQALGVRVTAVQETP
jgi:transcriptional regulator with XRE-family HTH domain